MLLRTLLLLACGALLAALDLTQLPSPRPAGWVSDPSGRLDVAASERCTVAARQVADRGAGELVVVVVPDCGGQMPRTAGLALFNRWGIGSRGRNDGVLILVALQERRAEILLGDGLDDSTNVQRSQALVEREILPRMRAGDVAGAIAAGTEAAARELFPQAAAPATPTLPATASTHGLERPLPPPAPATPVITRASSDSSTGSLLAGGAAAAGGGGLGFLWWRRRRPRTCPACRAPMTKLDEAADDAHLDPAQRSEEKVGSVDYDVWACTACSHVEVSRYGAWFTRYHRCPACGARTANDRSTTITPASESYTGLERIDTTCSHCQHQESRTRVLPRITRSTSHGAHFSSGSGSSRGGGTSSGRGGGGGW